MSMEAIRTRYGVPARRGKRVRYCEGGDTLDGTITIEPSDLEERLPNDYSGDLPTP